MTTYTIPNTPWTEAEAQKKIQEIAYKINDDFEGLPTAIIYSGALLFAAGTAGLAGNISKEDFLNLASQFFDNAAGHRKRMAH